MADDGSFQERILKTLEEIILGDPELSSFSIVPCMDNTTNRSPVLYQDHHLALESWSVRHVYAHAHAALLAARRSRGGVGAAARPSPGEARRLDRLLAGALLLNPDVSTFWSMRRELVQLEATDAARELRLSRLVLTRKGKSNETFAYRRWLLTRRLLPVHGGDAEALGRLHAAETGTAEMAAEKAPNNYHAFAHRMWCMRQVVDGMPTEAARTQVHLQELAGSLKWIERHVSEHTGYHYRQYIIKRFRSLSSRFFFEDCLAEVLKRLESDSDDATSAAGFFLHLFGVSSHRSAADLRKDLGLLNYLTLLTWELLVTVERLNGLFPEHESLWYHRRFLVHHLVQAFCEHHGLGQGSPGMDVSASGNNVVDDDDQLTFIGKGGAGGMSHCGEKQPKIFKSQREQIESSELGRLLTATEQRFVSDNSVGLRFQCDYARRHAKWLKLVVGLHNVC